MKINKFIFLILFFCSVAFSQVFVPQLTVDNLRLDGNTLSTLNTNGDLNLTPNGTGKIVTGANLNFSAFGGNKVLISDGSKNLSESSTSTTTLGYLDVSSSLTTLLGAKLGTSLTSAHLLVGNAGVATDTAITGDVTINSSGVTAIGSNKVANSQLAQMGSHSFKGNNTGSTANALDLTPTQLTAELNAVVGDSGSGGTKGLVPAPASGDAAASKYLKADGTWTTVSESGSGTGAKNYIANPDAETNTSGWATYADAAGTIPVDGTGGSPTTTWTRGTSTPLRGTGSFLYTKDANNRQGEGASYDFTIDNADQAKVLTISFYYLVSSGTYTDGDLKLFVYDVTNAKLVDSIAGQSILNIAGTNSYKQIATFQTNSNSTSYRFIIHDTTTNATAYTLKLDNFLLGPASMTTGPPMTDWKAFTMVIGATGSPPTKASSPDTDKAYWRRVGDTMEIQWDYYAISNAGAADGSGTYLFSLPPGYSIDTNKLAPDAASITNQIGTGAINGAGNNGIMYAFYVNTTQFSMAYMDGATTSIILTSGSGNITAAPIGYSVNVKVPIQGWSSNVAMSNDTDTKVIAARMTGAIATITSSYSDVTWSTIANDTSGAMGAINYTVPVTGYYNINGQLFGTATTIAAGNAWAVSLFNTTTSTTLLETTKVFEATNTTARGYPFVFEKVLLTAGTQVKIQVKSSTTTPVISASSTQNFLSIGRESGPAQIAATESVNARYHSSSTSLVASTFADIVYTTKDFDSHTGYSSATYTIPVSGKYQVNAGILLTAATTAANQLVQIQILKNGSAFSGPNEEYYTSSTSKPIGISISDLIPCVAGDTIKIQAASAGTTPSISASTTANYFSIARLGN